MEPEHRPGLAMALAEPRRVGDRSSNVDDEDQLFQTLGQEQDPCGFRLGHTSQNNRTSLFW